MWCLKPKLLPPWKPRPQLLRPAIAFCLFCLSLALYLSRLAPSVLPGDPGEYQIIAAQWGIGHPPGYGFYAVTSNLFTHLLPVGSFAWRANAFAAVCAAWMVALCYGIGRLLLPTSDSVSRRHRGRGARDDSADRGRAWQVLLSSRIRQELPPILGALTLATGIGFWQHAIHANAHILTALLAMLTLYCLVRQASADSGLERGGAPGRGSVQALYRNRWLYLAAFLAGLSPTQHPLLVFAFPAYVVFGLALLWIRYWRRYLHPVRGARQSRLYPQQKLSGLGRAGRVLLGVIGCVILGLGFYLYYPIRSSISAPPPPGPSDMNTWSGFVRVVTAQGLRGNLGGFALGQILRRLWDVRVPLLMQFSLPGLLLAVLGWISLWWPARRAQASPLAPRPRLVALLLTAYLACVVFVTVNVLQDAVAYLLGPMAVGAVLVGLGANVALRGVEWCVDLCGGRQWASLAAAVVAALLLVALPAWSLSVNWTRMNLRSFRDAEGWLAAVEERFVGQGQHAVLLVEWERMTTVYYMRVVQGREWDGRDLQFVPISAGTESPFLHAAEAHLAEGPVFLTMYRPQVAARYRLVPVPLGRSLSSPGAGWSGTLWQVLPGWPREWPPEGALWATGASPVSILAYAPSTAAGASSALMEIVGWRLVPDQGVSSTARSGEVLALDLFMRLPTDGASVISRAEPVTDALSATDAPSAYYLPWVRLGETTYHFTTASRFNTPRWQPGEIVVERFELPVPWLVGGTHAADVPDSLALQVGVQEVSQGRELHVIRSGETVEEGNLVSLASVPVALSQAPPRLERDLDSALGNLRGEILLRGARINGRRVDVGGEPFGLRPGRKLRVVLEWQSMRPIEDNYKVFVQLLDAGLQVRAQGDDKAPLGGSAPTLLWFPRWREGTRITDTYFLDVPPDLPAGTYPLIVGMYGFSTFQRLPVMSYRGATWSPVVQGDWITLAHMQVE